MGISTSITDKSVQSHPTGEQPAYATWVMQLATVADAFTPWGRFTERRDRELRAFWPTEPILAGAVATVCLRNATQMVVFDGPARTTKAIVEMWNECDFGHGAQHMLAKISADLYTQDNAAIIEII